MHGGYRTEAGGSHGHSVGVGVNGTGIGVHAATTGISIQTQGGSETRTRNLAYPLFIKY